MIFMKVVIMKVVTMKVVAVVVPVVVVVPVMFVPVMFVPDVLVCVMLVIGLLMMVSRGRSWAVQREKDRPRGKAGIGVRRIANQTSRRQQDTWLQRLSKVKDSRLFQRCP